jgi:hypothetical protein
VRPHMINRSVGLLSARDRGGDWRAAPTLRRHWAQTPSESRDWMESLTKRGVKSASAMACSSFGNVASAGRAFGRVRRHACGRSILQRLQQTPSARNSEHLQSRRQIRTTSRLGRAEGERHALLLHLIALRTGERLFLDPSKARGARALGRAVYSPPLSYSKIIFPICKQMAHGFVTVFD